MGEKRGAMIAGAEKCFVGRRQELRQFEDLLLDPRGRAIAVIGSLGIGKSALLYKMAEFALSQTKIRCGYVGYEITPVESPNALMEEMMHHAFDAMADRDGSFTGTDKKKIQWKSFFNALFQGQDNQADLTTALRYDPQHDICGQFQDRLNYLSKRMPENGRGIFFFDAGRDLQKSSEEGWIHMLQNLPPKIKFIFAQRPFDLLPVGLERSSTSDFSHLVKIPLDVLDDKSVWDLLEVYARHLQISPRELHAILAHYKGHPYALSAALDLIKDGEKPASLPKDPAPENVAEVQWKRIGEEHGYDAVRLFESFSVLDIPVPLDVACEVSSLSNTTIKSLLERPFIRGLMKREGERSQIYHDILSNRILAIMDRDDVVKYRRRAVDAYRRRLYSTGKPDELSARYLTQHMLHVASPSEVIYTFINESTPRLLCLGLYETAIDYTNQLLKLNAASDKIIEATLLGNLGVIFRTQGRLTRAEQIQRKTLDLSRKTGNLKGMAYAYINLGEIYMLYGKLIYAKSMYINGLNFSNKLKDVMGVMNACNGLGMIYLELGDLANAERSLKQALRINEQIGRLDGMAVQCGNLGLVYQKSKQYNEAQTMYEKAVEINRGLGDLEGVADNYYNLGILYRQQQDYGRAEEMHQSALEIFEQTGNLKGMADVYVNLAGIQIQQKQIAGAREYISQSRSLYSRLNMQDMVKKMDQWLDSLPESGD